MSVVGLIVHSLPWQIIARGGGGGSSSGGGGGGGLLIAIGYFPMHGLGAIFRRKDKVEIGNWITWPVAVVYSLLLMALFRGYGFVMAIGACMGAGAGLYGWLSKLKRNKKAEEALQKAGTADAAWDEPKLKEYVATVFNRFQYDWSRFDIGSIQKYVTPEYFQHVNLMLLAIKQASRVNQMSDVTITLQEIQSVNDAAQATQDEFVMGIQAKATDTLIDTRDNTQLHVDKSEFTEYWRFKRAAGGGWLLAGIQQATESKFMRQQTIEQFAKQQQFFYSADWGWLLLPRRGQIFSGGKFGVSDINNHCIGLYNNVLVQIYTYVPNPQRATRQYLVAQVQLPKSYGDIVVRRKKFVQWTGKSGLQEVKTEWTDFNKKFEVLASTAEGPTSLELLHPAFMEFLEKQPFEINLEVTDNVVYFYANESGVKPEHYPVMLAVMQEAFKQMKM